MPSRAIPQDGTPLPLSDDVLPLEKVRNQLAALWLIAAAVLTLILVMQSLLGKYGDVAQEVWGWALPTIMPTLGMIISVLGYTALDPTTGNSVVRKSFSAIAFWLSVLYLLLIGLTVIIQPFSGKDPIQLMRLSNLWLGPFQGLVASALGVLFVSKRKR
jgi:hypothetical protein